MITAESKKLLARTSSSLAWIAGILLLLPLSAFAALGGDVSSVQADSVHMKGALRIMNAQAYTVHEIRAESGMVVREFVNASGKVFAVAFQGPHVPNWQQLLGDYFPQFRQAVQGNRAMNHRVVSIQEPGLVVQAGGHMRSYSGRAYLPDAIPSGVSADSVR